MPDCDVKQQIWQVGGAMGPHIQHSFLRRASGELLDKGLSAHVSTKLLADVGPHFAKSIVALVPPWPCRANNGVVSWAIQLGSAAYLCARQVTTGVPSGGSDEAQSPLGGVGPLAISQTNPRDSQVGAEEGASIRPARAA